MAKLEKNSYPTELSNLLDMGRNVKADEFLRLVKNTIQTLDNESGQVGNLEITGKLISVPPMGKAIVVGDIHGDLEGLKYILEDSGFLEKAKEDENVFIVFLGYAEDLICIHKVIFQDFNLEKVLDRV